MIKKHGFTLAEVLLSIVIIGVIAVLTLPSLLNNIHQKTRMNLLKGVVATVNDAVQKEFTKERTTDITLTDIYKDPEAFLEKFELAKAGEPFGTEYKRYSDAKVTNDVLIPNKNTDNQATALLKNGVGIGIVNDIDNRTTSVVVDLTGNDKPNMVGSDYYIFKIEWDDDIHEWGDDTNGESNYNSTTRAGTVGSYKIGGATGSELKNECTAGNGAACFRMAELSGYDPNYLD